jgi:hypothetical protein
VFAVILHGNIPFGVKGMKKKLTPITGNVDFFIRMAIMTEPILRWSAARTDSRKLHDLARRPR